MMPVRFFPAAGVVVYEGETDEQAFARAAAERAQWERQQAEERRLVEWKARPWWQDDPPPVPSPNGPDQPRP